MEKIFQRSDYLHAAPFKMYNVGFRQFQSPLYLHRRANRTDFFLKKIFRIISWKRKFALPSFKKRSGY